MLIQDSKTLRTFCEALADAPYVAVDTEFLRERTYHAELCLVQVAYGERAAAIDPLIEDLDLTPLKELLCNESIVKVLHSATQDMAIFLEKIGRVPGPVFDTQIAASVCGHGHQPGYAGLVESMLGVQIDKSSQAVDWSLRPLSDRQLEYALGDVTHLCSIYEQLLAELASLNRAHWVTEEMAGLLDPARYTVEPKEAYRRVKLRRPERRHLVVLRDLAAWREEMAMTRNLPRGWVIRDDALAEIALHAPESVEELARVRSLKAPVAKGPDGQRILELVVGALASPSDSWPELPVRRETGDRRESLVALLQALLRLRSEAHGVSTAMIARSGDLEKLALGGADADLELLHGWRRELYGDAALQLCAGTLALTGDGETVVEVSITP